MGRMFAMLTTGIAIGASIVGASWVGHVASRDNDALSSRVTTLEHACVPVDTGGGVTQCAQPALHVSMRVAGVVCAFRAYEDASIVVERDDEPRFDCMRELTNANG